MSERISDVLGQMGVRNVLSAAAVRHEEDDACYEVWTATAEEGTYILKKAKGCEFSAYTGLLKDAQCGVPRLLKAMRIDGEDYLLLEYVQGSDLRKCDRKSLTLVLDALIALQEQFWGKTEFDGVAVSFDQSLQHRRQRGKYLNDRELEKAYDGFLKLYPSLPRTLCHDDLLPFNVIVTQHDAKLIDWETAGILPYPVTLARLIAHAEEAADAFFYMTEADKKFAVDYYFDRLVKGKGISYGDYRRALDACLLYEYCEWIMLGVKYPDGDMTRYARYLKKAKQHIRDMI